MLIHRKKLRSSFKRWNFSLLHRLHRIFVESKGDARHALSLSITQRFNRPDGERLFPIYGAAVVVRWRGFSRLSDRTDKETFYLGPGKSATTENRPRKKITGMARCTNQWTLTSRCGDAVARVQKSRRLETDIVNNDINERVQLCPVTSGYRAVPRAIDIPCAREWCEFIIH